MTPQPARTSAPFPRHGTTDRIRQPPSRAARSAYLPRVKHVTMADKSLLIGDEAADLLLSYAALVAKVGGGDEVRIRAIGVDGDEVTVGFLLNSGTVLLIESAGDAVKEPDNADAVAYMSSRIASYRGLDDEISPFNTVPDEA